MDFNFGSLTEGKVSDKVYIHSLYLEGVEDPILVHLHPSCSENEDYSRAVRVRSLAYRQRAQRKRNHVMELTRALSREVFPKTIVFKVENCPIKDADPETFSDLENLKNFCNDLPPTYFDELSEVASNLGNFYESAIDLDEEVLDAAQELGEGTSAD